MKRAAKRLARRLLTAARRGRPVPDVYPDANPLYAHRCFAGKVERWNPVPSESAPNEAISLADDIFQPPGFVAVEGSVFDLREEGVYRFYRLPRLSEQRIVWHGDLDSLLFMLGYLWVHGSVDNTIVDEQGGGLTLLRQRVIAASCSRLARLAVMVLATQNITGRTVACITLDPWGRHDDGHVLVEIWSPVIGLFLYDSSFNRCFLSDGQCLSLVDVVRFLRCRQVRLERLPGNTGHVIHRAEGYDYGFAVDERRESDELLYDWYRRMAGVPLIHGVGAHVFAADVLTARDLERLSRRYRAMDREAFLKHFYGTSTIQRSGDQCQAQ